MAFFAVKKQPPIDVTLSEDLIVEQCRAKLAEGELSGDAETDKALAARLICDWLAESGADTQLRTRIVDAAIDNLLGYGPLEPLMSDPGISEIMVNGCDDVWIERSGRLQRTAAQFRNAEQLHVVLDRLLMGAGRRIDRSSPIVDATLPDGSRLNAVMAPVAAETPLLTIRKFPPQPLDLAQLIENNSIGARMAAFLHAALLGRVNILISGGTGSGKTTLLGALTDVVPHDQRVVLIEDVRELRCTHPHAVSQQCHPGGTENRTAVTIRDLVRNALRMRPDRLIVGEVRGIEAADMVQAMNTGHSGSMTTLHANSAADAMSRLEAMLAMAWPAIDAGVLRRWLGSAIDIVVHVERGGDGRRRVQSVVALEDTVDGFQLTPVFTTFDTDFRGCGELPQRCLERMAYHGIRFPVAMFAAS